MNDYVSLKWQRKASSPRAEKSKMAKKSQQSTLRRWKILLRWIWLFSVVGPSEWAVAGNLPSLHPGMWEYNRTIQRSDQDWVPKDLSVHVCEDPNEVLRKQNEIFEKLGCTIVATRIAEDTYRVTAECPEKNGMKITSQSISTFAEDSAYTSVIESEVSAAGRPVKFAERLSAKRIGDCEK